MNEDMVVFMITLKKMYVIVLDLCFMVMQSIYATLCWHLEEGNKLRHFPSVSYL